MAPETLLDQDLFFNVNRNDTFLTKITSNSEISNIIFEKLQVLQKKSTSIISPVHLSPQEEAVLNLPNNVLLLGRSGTGKTTCGLLRLFSRYHLFCEYEKMKKEFDQPSPIEEEPLQIEEAKVDQPMEGNQGKNKKEEVQITNKEGVLSKYHKNGVNESFHSVFLTLSPVLCEQARKYFNKLTGRGSSSAATAKKQEENLAKAEKKEVEEKKEVAEGEEEDGVEYEGEVEAEEEEMEEGEGYDNERYPHRLSDVKDEDFPMFITLRNFLYMLDGTLEEPFFARESNGRIQGADKAFTFQEELGFVNVVHRKTTTIEAALEDLLEENENYNSEEEEFKEMLEELKEEMEDDAGSDGEDDRGEEDKKENQNESQLQNDQKGNLRTEKTTKVSFEITYDYFASIYQHLGKTAIHPSIVWTEIQSFIKGSSDALGSTYGFLTKQQYISFAKKRSAIPTAVREEIYSLFVNYEKLKRQQMAFDLQDIVFYIFTRLDHEGYRGELIHSITIDEVQDFTQSTLQLLMSICKQQSGFFFTGDSCQTIARGVGFRFTDLQSLFHYRNLTCPIFGEKSVVPSIHQLTINFRSHSGLIQLGLYFSLPSLFFLFSFFLSPSPSPLSLSLPPSLSLSLPPSPLSPSPFSFYPSLFVLFPPFYSFLLFPPYFYPYLSISHSFLPSYILLLCLFTVLLYPIFFFHSSYFL